MAFNGVRISCDMLCRNAVFNLSFSSAFSFGGDEFLLHLYLFCNIMHNQVHNIFSKCPDTTAVDFNITDTAVLQFMLKLKLFLFLGPGFFKFLPTPFLQEVYSGWLFASFSVPSGYTRKSYRLPGWHPGFHRYGHPAEA